MAKQSHTTPDIILKDWNIRQVIKLAAGANDMVTARSLQLSPYWKVVAHDGYSIWAEYEENDKKKYDVKIDMVQVQAERKGFSCTCSRHRPPCEHALAVLLTVLEDPDAYYVAEAPPPVLQWLDRRSRRVRARLERQPYLSADDTDSDDSARAQLSSTAQHDPQRFASMLEGLAELDQWLKNLVRQGLGHVPVAESSFWEAITKRMVDAYLPGIALKLKDIARIPRATVEWSEPLLAEVGKLYLLVDAFQRYHDMPLPIQADMREAVGWPFKTLPTDAPLDLQRDAWVVLGRRDFKHNRNSWVRRSWLYGRESQRYAVIKEFVFDPALFALNVHGGYEFEATLAFFPSRFPLRAQLVSTHNDPVPTHDVPTEPTLQSLKRYTAACARNPWLSEITIASDAVLPYRHEDKWYLKLSDDAAAALHPGFSNHWPLMALSGGYPLRVIAEWDGYFMYPLAAIDDRYVDLTDTALS